MKFIALRVYGKTNVRRSLFPRNYDQGRLYGSENHSAFAEIRRTRDGIWILIGTVFMRDPSNGKVCFFAEVSFTLQIIRVKTCFCDLQRASPKLALSRELV